MSQSPIYRVTETGEIGQLIPCPCDDPIILEFKDGIRDAFFLRELEPVPISSRTHGKSCEARIPLCGTGSTHPITASYSTRRRNAKNRGKGRPKGMARGTIEKMLAIYRFLETQSEAVYRSAIEKAVDFNCTRCLMYQPSQKTQVTLESLGIVERIPGERTWVAWRLTELGRTEGVDIIRGLK